MSNNYRIIVGGKVQILLGLSTQVGAEKNAARLEGGLASAKAFFATIPEWTPEALAKSVGSFGGVTEDCLNIHGWLPVTQIPRVEAWLQLFARSYEQLDVFLSEFVTEEHPNGRPMVYYWTMQKGLEDTLTAVSCIVKDTGIDGFLIDDTGAKNKRIMGVFAQYIPEICMRWDPEHRFGRYEWLKKAIKTTICSTRVDWVSTRVFASSEPLVAPREIPNYLDEIQRRSDALDARI